MAAQLILLCRGQYQEQAIGVARAIKVRSSHEMAISFERPGSPALTLSS